MNRAPLPDSQVPEWDEIQSRFKYHAELLILRNGHQLDSYRGIVAIGSSIMKLWFSLKQDLYPHKVINHGFCGSRTWEMIHYGRKLVTDFKPKAVIIYCGSNDIRCGDSRGCKTAQKCIYQWYLECSYFPPSISGPVSARICSFLRYLEQDVPGVRVVFLSIQKAPEKRQRWSTVDRTNLLVKDYIENAQDDVGHSNWRFIDINVGTFGKAVITEKDNPLPNMFCEDGLHLTDHCYKSVFATAVMAALRDLKVWRFIPVT